MITPGDITDEQLQRVVDSGIGHFKPPELIAAILNSAIEAGLVSPPAWAIQYRYNSDIGHNEFGTLLFDSKGNAEAFREKHCGDAPASPIPWRGEKYEE